MASKTHPKWGHEKDLLSPSLPGEFAPALMVTPPLPMRSGKTEGWTWMPSSLKSCGATVPIFLALWKKLRENTKNQELGPASSKCILQSLHIFFSSFLQKKKKKLPDSQAKKTNTQQTDLEGHGAVALLDELLNGHVRHLHRLLGPTVSGETVAERGRGRKTKESSWLRGKNYQSLPKRNIKKTKEATIQKQTNMVFG